MKRREMLQTTLGVGALALCPSLLLAKEDDIPIGKFEFLKSSECYRLTNRDEVFGEWGECVWGHLYEQVVDANGKPVYENIDGCIRRLRTDKVVGKIGIKSRYGWVRVNSPAYIYGADDLFDVHKLHMEDNFDLQRFRGIIKLKESQITTVRYNGPKQSGSGIISVVDLSKATKVV